MPFIAILVTTSPAFALHMEDSSVFGFFDRSARRIHDQQPSRPQLRFHIDDIPFHGSEEISRNSVTDFDAFPGRVVLSENPGRRGLSPFHSGGLDLQWPRRIARFVMAPLNPVTADGAAQQFSRGILMTVLENHNGGITGSEGYLFCKLGECCADVAFSGLYLITRFFLSRLHVRSEKRIMS